MTMSLKFSFMVLASHKDTRVLTDLLPLMDLVLDIQARDPQQQEFLGFVLERLPQEANC